MLRPQILRPTREGTGDYQAGRYRPRRCRLPDPVPYVYQAPRPGWATAGLDLDAIRAADAELDGRRRTR